MGVPARRLADWLELQQRIHPRSIELGLARVSAVARALGVDRPGVPTWIVGGTNGKGSTVALLEAMLAAAGVVTGAFTSPHLVRYNERVRIGGVEATDAELVGAFEAIERARGTTTLTYFEFSALAALLVFRRRGVAAQVLEVGLGGRLDAVNLVDADVAVLCSIGHDHHEWLGPTLDDIGREKAGIFRAGRPAVLGSAALPASVWDEIARIGARPLLAGRDFSWAHTRDAGDPGNGGNDSVRWDYRSAARSITGLPRPALAGDIQFDNAATAIAALDAGPIAVPDAAIRAGLGRVRLPGRFQIVPGEVEWILDVAHNLPAAAAFAHHLAARPVAGRTIAVAGFLDDKDVAAIGRLLAPAIDAWVVASLPPPRGLPAASVVERLPPGAAPAVMCDSVDLACARAQAIARPGDRVVAFGSFHVVGPVLEWLRLY